MLELGIVLLRVVCSRFSGHNYGVGTPRANKFVMANAKVEQAFGDVERKIVKSEEAYRDSLKYCMYCDTAL